MRRRLGEVKRPVVYSKVVSTDYNDSRLYDIKMKPLNETHPHLFAVKSEGASKAKDVNVGDSANDINFNSTGEYFKYINDIGKSNELTIDQKMEKVHEAYETLRDFKGDVTVVADKKYLKPEAFGPNGRFIEDWPDKMGFTEDSMQAVNRNNPLPEQWDRIGGKGGENFTTLPDNRAPFTYDERAIPYLENPSARHVGTFDNHYYFDAIDAN